MAIRSLLVVAITLLLVVAITTLLVVAALQLGAEQVLVAHRARRGQHTTHNTRPRAPWLHLKPKDGITNQKESSEERSIIQLQEYVLTEWVGGGVWAYLPTCLGGWGGWLVGWLVGRGQTGFTDRCPKHLLRTPGMALWQHARHQQCPSKETDMIGN